MDKVAFSFVSSTPKIIAEQALSRDAGSFWLFRSKELLHSFTLFLNKLSNNYLKEKGFVSELLLTGVGFKFEGINSSARVLLLNLGYSHEIYFFIQEEINYKLLKQYLSVFGYDKNLVTQVAAKIRSLRAPDSYKRKGIKYLNEVVLQKKGKQKQQK